MPETSWVKNTYRYAGSESPRLANPVGRQAAARRKSDRTSLAIVGLVNSEQPSLDRPAFPSHGWPSLTLDNAFS